MRTKKISNNELSDILKISSRQLKRLSHDKIKERLLNVGYNYYGKDNKGKHKVILFDKTKKEFFTMCKQEFKTDKTNEFKTYFIKRTDKDEILSRKDIANCSNTTIYMIDKWDRIMLDKSIISENGWAYFKITNDVDGNRYVEQCDRKEYNLFWNVKLSMKYYKEIRDKFEKGEISTEEMQLRSIELSRLEDGYEGFFYYKIKMYNVNEENPVYLDIKTLIFSRNS